MTLRYLTAGESHGPCLTAIVEGLPANLPVCPEDIDRHLRRRQQGYGRGGRMAIEKDAVEFQSGIRWGKTLGSPVTLSIANRDWENWSEKMSPHAESAVEGIAVTRPRPGHADLTGVVKYRQEDARNILERSSARETAARVAVGAMCLKLLSELKIRVLGYVTEICDIRASGLEGEYIKRFELSEKSPCRTFDRDAEEAMIRRIDQAKTDGDSLGGVVEVVVTNLPMGLGSHVHWDRKLDARLAAAMMSIQAFKGVEVGIGFDAARTPGSAVHDEILYRDERFSRRTNRAGGVEGGMTNGEPLVVRGAMKPIPTLYSPLNSVDFHSKESFLASVERSDVCAVPAAAVVAESVVAIEIVQALFDKFSHDTMEDLSVQLRDYRNYVASF